MQYSILEEMTYIRNNEKEKRMIFPKTCYLFVENYGRNMEEDMDSIAKLQGYEEWFTFRADWNRKQQGLYQELQVELQKHAKLGREFEGCIVINIAGQVEESELGLILDDLKEKEGKVSFIISVEDHEKAKQVQEIMNRNFYTRIVEGKPYGAEEQFGILESELEKYGFGFEEAQQGDIFQYLSGLTWRKEENVNHKLQNTAKKLVYERMMTEAQSVRMFEKDELENALGEIHKEDKKAKIGFVCNI